MGSDQRAERALTRSSRSARIRRRSITFYICPAGTSVAQGPQRPGEDAAAFDERISRRIAAVREKRGADLFAFLVEVSAETNGLARVNCGRSDDVLLLASDTDDGERSAEAVAALIREELGTPARVKRIEGLTTKAEPAFRQTGIRNLLNAVHSATRNTSHDAVVFNVTGGFKGVVPYLTLLGMFDNRDVIYVFETSDAVIRLPPLPVRFDLERMASALPALLVLRERGIMPESEFREFLPDRGFADQALTAQLIEMAGGDVALSAAGELAVTSFRAPGATQDRLFVRHAVKNGAFFANQAVQQKLSRLMDQSFRARPLNSATMRDSTDLLICKPRGHGAPRIYYRVENGRVFVVEIVSHHEHQHVIQPGQRRIWWNDYKDHPFDEVTLVAADDPDAWGEELSAWLDERTAAVDEAASVRSSLEQRIAHLSEQSARHRRGEAHQRERADKAEAQRASDAAQRQVDTGRLLRAADFAASAFRGKRRKDAAATPYINHLTQVVAILANAGVTDVDVLIAGFLHDAIEDVGVTGEEIELRFGRRVRLLVEEVSDDKSLPKEERKRLQIARAPEKSTDAQLLVLADKIANLRDLATSPPADWPQDHVVGYYDWAKNVVAGLSGNDPVHEALKTEFNAAPSARPVS